MILSAFIIALPAVVVCVSGFARAEEQPSAKLTLISNVDIFDGQTETLHQDMYVLVKSNLIETVSYEPLVFIQTDNVTMIDGGGRSLMPGMIKAHGHVTFASPLVKMLIGQAKKYKVRSSGGRMTYQSMQTNSLEPSGMACQPVIQQCLQTKGESQWPYMKKTKSETAFQTMCTHHRTFRS